MNDCFGKAGWLLALIAGVLVEGHAGNVALDVAARLGHGPGGMTVAPDGSLIVGIHPCFGTRERVLRVNRAGEVDAFPTVEMSTGSASENPPLDSVMGVQSGANGVVWLLDSGRKGAQVPKVVGWNFHTNKLHQVIYLPPPATTETSYLVDLAVHPDGTHLVIADPAFGADAALIVVDLKTNVGRRVLQGHSTVLAESIPFTVSGRKLGVRMPDGSFVEPLTAVNPIALDRKGKYLYYGAMKGRSLYRIPAAKLWQPDATEGDLAGAIERYSDKPICDSIAMDAKDNIYAADLARSAIVVITPKKRQPETYVSDPKLCWPDGLTFGGDGKLYFYCSQVSRTDWYGDKNEVIPPFPVYRIKPLYQPLITNPLPDHGPLTGIRDLIPNPFGKE